LDHRLQLIPEQNHSRHHDENIGCIGHLIEPEAAAPELDDMDIFVLRIDRTRQPKNDPILCIGNGTGDVECNYADELE
jgi:hypothetical protein